MIKYNREELIAKLEVALKYHFTKATFMFGTSQLNDTIHIYSSNNLKEKDVEKVVSEFRPSYKGKIELKGFR